MTKKSYRLPKSTGLNSGNAVQPVFKQDAAVISVPPATTVNGNGTTPTNGQVVAVSDNQLNGVKETSLGPEVDTENRGSWGTKLEFLLSCMALSVGLGNVWRFPNVAYNNGGGAFLIPYLIVLVIIGRPLYYMELVLGQFSGAGPIKVWKVVPALKGIGYAQMVSTLYIMIFYNYLMALTIYYLFASMASELPWTRCDPEWAGNETCFILENNLVNETNNSLTSLPQLYFDNHVLNKSASLDEVNSIDWPLPLCLLLAWLIVFLTIIKGIESLGKVAYFTALFPYSVLIALLIVAMLNEGSVAGIEYFFKPKWEDLLRPEVWYNACEQSFFSLAVGYGALVMYASYNDFKHNVNKDALIISFTDTFTSLLAGSVIFSVLGTLALKQGKPVESVVKGKEGMGLAFIAYPEALGNIPYVPQLWSVMFFIMLFTLGIGSSVAQVETILTAIRDRWPSLREGKWRLALGMSIFCFACGIPLTTNGGSYIMLLLDNYGVGTAVFFYGICEVIGIMWVYGINRFCQDVHFMLGQQPSWFWKITWGFVTPVSLIVIFIYGNVIVAGNTKPGIPPWGNALGWGLAAIAITQIPLWIIIEIVKRRGDGFLGAISGAFRPDIKWGPKNAILHQEWLAFRSGNGKSKDLEEVKAQTQYDNAAFDSNENGKT